MLQEENELLTQVGPGTPCGELMRRYWQPVALTEELPKGGAPLPVRLLGEDLVLFRTEGDRGNDRPLSTQHSELSTAYGLLGLHCSHRGADLSYGRLEDGGLRCIYHGWLYDLNGRCLEQPGEPAGSTFNEKILHRAYPCLERAGTIFAYLGPGAPPEFPNYEFLCVPPENIYSTKRYHQCSYLQSNEGNIDLSHLSFLHYMNAPYGVSSEPARQAGPAAERGNASGDPRTAAGTARISHRGVAPSIETADAELTPYGVRSCKIREAAEPGQKHLYVTEFVLPNFTAFWVGPNRDQTGRAGYSVNWHVPIDDTHHWKYTFTFGRGTTAESERERARFRTEMVDYQPVRNLSNRFLQSRAEMERDTYLGIGTDFQVHDKWATEGQGPIQDRTQEHLGAFDLPLTMSRKVMIKAMQDLQEGREPANVIRDPAKNQLPIATCSILVPIDT
ncbi:MAG TPA: Rieske 2Fe-2S domain-containing protein, partial [Chloroflexota bacterium]